MYDIFFYGMSSRYMIIDIVLPASCGGVPSSVIL
jgi:hypothetical protein